MQKNIPKYNTSKIAYLVSEYPAISHAFIYTEIAELRKQGVSVDTFSINLTKNASQLQPLEQAEIESTIYIKAINPIKALFSTVSFLIKHPQRYTKMFMAALSLGKKGLKSFLKGLGYLVESVLLLNELNKRNISHVHNHFGNAAAMVAMISERSGLISYSLSLHGPAIFDSVDSELLEEKIKHAKFIRTISQYCQSQAMKLVPFEYWHKFSIVRCGVDLNHFSCHETNKNEVPVLLCVGRLVSQKAQHILVEASYQLKNQGIEHQLIFVGAGPDLQSLEHLVAQRKLDSVVSFAGAIGQQALIHYYNKADILVLPSFSEGIPVVLMEAMAMKLPVVSTRVAGIPELIESECEGLLVSPSSVGELSDAIQKLIHNPSLTKEYSDNAFHKVTEHYNASINSIKMAELFNAYLYKNNE